jgi:hypothetical protein
LGIELGIRQVNWEDWPGQSSDSRAVCKAPKDLAEVEKHFRQLDRKRKAQHMKDLQKEVERIAEELSNDSI